MRWLAISRDLHGNLGLSKKRSYSFAQNMTLIPISFSDIAACQAIMPLAFSKKGEIFEFVGLVGFKPNQNLYVGANGSWRSPTIPSILQAYPFKLGAMDGGKNAILFPEENNVVVDRKNGEPFFEEDGSEGKALISLANLLGSVKVGEQLVRGALDVIEKLELLKAWPLKISVAGQTMQLDGLYGIDEGKLNEIDDKDFLELRRSKALNLIYGHFYSFSSIRRLITIYEIIKNNQKSSEQLGKAIFETEEIAELNFNFEAEGEKL